MYGRLFMAAALLLSCAAHAAAQQTAAKTAALSADEIVRKHVEARGGAEKLKAIKSLKISGRALLQGGAVEAPATIYLKRPALMRFELTVQGTKLVQAFDGTNAWGINPFEGSFEPRLAPDEEARAARDDADMDGPLVDYKAKGYKVELVGREDSDGVPAYKLKVSAANGDVSHLFIDARTFLTFREISRRRVQGVEAEIESASGDYRRVDGVMMAYSVENKVNGRTAARFVVEKVEPNVALDDALFRMPAGPAPAKP